MKFTYEATLKWISTLDNASALILKSVNSCLFEGHQKFIESHRQAQLLYIKPVSY